MFWLPLSTIALRGMIRLLTASLAYSPLLIGFRSYILTMVLRIVFRVTVTKFLIPSPTDICTNLPLNFSYEMTYDHPYKLKM